MICNITCWSFGNIGLLIYADLSNANLFHCTISQGQSHIYQYYWSFPLFYYENSFDFTDFFKGCQEPPIVLRRYLVHQDCIQWSGALGSSALSCAALSSEYLTILSITSQLKGKESRQHIWILKIHFPEMAHYFCLYSISENYLHSHI
jgi:hypothetical protein